MKAVQRFEVFADYHQFYLMDAEAQPQIPESVLPADTARRLRCADHIVVFHTESASKVPVEVGFVDCAPTEAENWEQITDFSVSLPSGTAALCGCTDYVPDCPRLTGTPGSYNGKAFFAGATSLGGERYRVLLWPQT